MTSSMDLAQLFNHYGSDKDVNGYAQLYHTLFQHRIPDVKRFLEIGIGTMIAGAPSSMQGYALEGYRPGGSLRAWRDYFPNAHVLGADVQPDTQFTEERIETVLCDSTNREAVDDAFGKVSFTMGEIYDKDGRVIETFAQSGSPIFDIIIDDGSHLDTHQIATLTNFFPRLAPGGLYIIEDIYPGSALSRTPEILEAPTDRSPFFFVGVQNNLCVIHKTKLQSRRRGY